MHKRGELAEAHLDGEFLSEAEEKAYAKRVVAALDKLTGAEDAKTIVAMASKEMDGETFHHAIKCLAKLGAVREAWDLLLKVNMSAADWRKCAVTLGTAAISVQEESLDVLDRPLAETIVRRLVALEYFLPATRLLLEFAISDAQAAVNAKELQRRGEEARNPNSIFERALNQMRVVAKKRKLWKVGWEEFPQRWNLLLRLIAKKRCMQDVFDVVKTMDHSKVFKDLETYEFVARSAVAGVSPVSVVDSFAAMPPPNFPEIVFLGKSNVGKSSLVNNLLHRKALAPVSALPGHTTRFHFYEVNKDHALFPRMAFVDVPGFGMAVAEEVQIRHWRETLLNYLRNRGPSLRGVFALISAEEVVERGMTAMDLEIAKLCQDTKLDYTLVLTKVDTIKGQANVTRTVKSLRHWLLQEGVKCKDKHIVCSSTKTREGRDTLWRRLWASVDPGSDKWAGDRFLVTKQELIDLAAEGKAEEIEARIPDLGGDAWEYAVRCLVQLGALRGAWHAISAVLGLGCEGVRPLKAVEERALLCLGEAAIQVGDDGSVGDEALGHHVLSALLQRGRHSPRAELLLEQAVAQAQLASLETSEARQAAYERSMETLQEILSNARSLQGSPRPWSLDCWRRFVYYTLLRGDFHAFSTVLDAMDELCVRENAETNSTIVRGCASSLQSVEEVPEEPELAFLDGTGAFRDVDPVLDSLFLKPLAMKVKRPFVDEGQVARRLLVNSEPGAVFPTFTCLDVPLAYPENQDMELTGVDQLAVGDVRALIGKPRKKPLSVFHVVNARSFSKKLWRGAPPDMRRAKKYELESLSLSETDLAMQEEALRAGVAHYTLLITESDEIRKQPTRSQGVDVMQTVPPDVIKRRTRILTRALLKPMGDMMADIDLKLDAQLMFVDFRSGRGVRSLWRRLWECAL